MKNVRFFLTFSLQITVLQQDTECIKLLKTMQSYTFFSIWQKKNKKIFFHGSYAVNCVLYSKKIRIFAL